MEKENRTNVKVQKALALLHTHKALQLSLDIWQFRVFSVKPEVLDLNKVFYQGGGGRGGEGKQRPTQKKRRPRVTRLQDHRKEPENKTQIFMIYYSQVCKTAIIYY